MRFDEEVFISILQIFISLIWGLKNSLLKNYKTQLVKVSTCMYYDNFGTIVK